MKCFPKPDHDWVDAEFLVFCSSGLSELIYASLISDDEEEEEVVNKDLNIPSVYSTNSNSLQVCSYFIYNENGSRIQISAVLRNKMRKGPLLYLISPVSEIVHQVQTKGSLCVKWMRKVLNWDITHDYILSPYISMEADFQNLKLPTDLHGKLKLIEHAKVTNISSIMCHKIFFLECETWLKKSFQENIALVMRYSMFFPAQVPIIQLHLVYVQDFDYPLPPCESTYVKVFQSKWYSNKVFLDFCKYVQFRERDPFILELNHLWRKMVASKEWMDVHYFEILRETNNCLWFDIDKEYRNVNKFSQQADQHTMFLQRAKERISRCLKLYSFPEFYYSRYNLMVNTNRNYYLAHRLCTYHPALFKNQRRRKSFFPLLDMKAFHRKVGKGANRKMVCLSASKDTLYSNYHSTTTKDYLPCPVLLVHEIPQEQWSVSCTGNPDYYGTEEEKKKDLGDVVERITKDADGDTVYICKHLTWFMNDLVHSEPTGFNYHEVINPFLSLTSIPFDLDFKNLKKPLCFEEILSIADGISQGMRIFLNIIRKEENYDTLIPDLRTFVYKSACSSDGYDCTCTKKLGLRIIVKLPNNVIISNIRALRSCTNLIITLIKSHFQTVQIIEGNCDIISNVLDINIWDELKSHRLPFSYKEGNTRQLLPIFTFDQGLKEKCDIECKLKSLLDPFTALIHRDFVTDAADKKVFVCEGVPEEEEEEEEEFIAIKGYDKEITKTELMKKVDDSSAVSLLLRSLYMQMRQSKLKLAYHLFTPKIEEGVNSTYLQYNLLTSQGESKFPVCLQEDKKKRSNKVLYFILVKAEGEGVIRLYLMCKCFACNNNVAKCILNWIL